MKYYIYISETKLDMLFPQIPHDQRTRIARELKIDLKLISASIEEEKDFKETKYSKAELVTRYIQNNCEVGTIDKPKDYIHDILEMKWDHFEDFGIDGSPVVFFGGKTDLTIFGMGGALYHIIGSNPKYDHSPVSPRLFYHLNKHRIKVFLYRHKKGVSEDKEKAFRAFMLAEKLKSSGKLSEEKDALSVVEFFVNIMEGPSERLEFLAKTLLIGREKRVVLATPIYVALANIVEE